MDWRETSHPPDTLPAAMQQHSAYGRACKALGSSIRHVVAGPGMHPFAYAQVLVRRSPLMGSVAMVARGPIWCQPTSVAEARLALRGLQTFLKDSHHSVILTPERLDGLDPMDGTGLLPMVTPSSSARLFLDGSSTDRLARQHGKWRNRLRRAEDGPLRISQGPFPVDPNHWLLKRETLQARQRRYRRLPASFTQAWRHVNGAKSTRLFTAFENGEPVAAMLFLLHGDTASYHIGWSGDQGRKRNAHPLLLWRASEWCASKGMEWIDLGTLDTESTPSLARFKLGAGAKPITLGTTWLDAPGSRTVAKLSNWLTQPRARGLQTRTPV